MASLEECRTIELAALSNASGTLTYLEGEQDIPFAVRRLFWIYDLHADSRRGGHAYREQEQLIVALAGGFDLRLHNGRREELRRLERPHLGLYLPPGIWREMRNPVPGAVALVLSSHRFDPGDAIDDFEEFAAGAS